MVRLRVAVLLFVCLGLISAGSMGVLAQQSGSTKCTVDKTPPSPADQALYANDYGSAAKLYRQIADKNPASAEGQAGLIRAMLGQNKLADALAAANKLVSQQPQNAVAQTVLGETYLRRGEFDLALPVLVKAAKLDPCYGRAYYAEARMESLSGKRATAERLLGAAHGLSPMDPQIDLAWIETLPAAQRYPALDAYVQGSYLKGSDLQDLKSSIGENKLATSTHCTVVAPKGETSLPLHTSQRRYGPDQASITVIDVNLDGKDRRLNFGTQGRTITIPLPEANRLGLKLEGPFVFNLTYGGGKNQYYVATVPSIRFGDVEYRNCPVQVFDTPYASENMQGSDGYVGAGFFADFLVNINIPAETLSLSALPKLDLNEANGRPFWSTAGQEDHAEVASINSGDWAPYNATVAPEMKDWVRVVSLGRNILLVPTRIGPGHERLFTLALSIPHNRISSTAVGEAVTLDSMISGSSKEKAKEVSKLIGDDHYFMEFGGLVLPIDSWNSIEFDKDSIKAGIDVAGVISQIALKQLDVKIDYRDDLVKFTRPPNQPPNQ